MTVQAIESNPTNGEVYDLTEDYSFTVGGHVIADADTPTAIGGTYATEEDTPWPDRHLAARWSTPMDQALTFRITGVPSGATFSAGTDLGGGIWSFTPAQSPPASLHAAGQCLRHLRYDARLDRDRGRERRYGAEFRRHPCHRRCAGRCADRATSAASGVEDTAILFGDKVSITLADTDGSERVNQVTILGPADGRLAELECQPCR